MPIQHQLEGVSIQTPSSVFKRQKSSQQPKLKRFTSRALANTGGAENQDKRGDCKWQDKPTH
jgi:hypothetical protein